MEFEEKMRKNYTRKRLKKRCARENSGMDDTQKGIDCKDLYAYSCKRLSLTVSYCLYLWLETGAFRKFETFIITLKRQFSQRLRACSIFDHCKSTGGHSNAVWIRPNQT